MPQHPSKVMARKKNHLRPRSSMRAMAMAGAVAAAAATLSSAALADETKHIAKITINGEGSVAVAPDLAIFDLGVVQEASTAREALDLNNKLMTDVVAAMKSEGIADKDLQTSNFSIQPRYSHHRPKKGEEQTPPKIVGYVVSNNLTVRVRDMTKVGSVLDQSVTLGVNSGGSIRFGNDDPAKEIARARSLAMQDAIERANTLLEAAGASLGPIMEINEGFSQPAPVPVNRARMMAAEDASVPVQGGENTYKVNVTVTWQIEQ